MFKLGFWSGNIAAGFDGLYWQLVAGNFFYLLARLSYSFCESGENSVQRV
jgi:hypothetical protein